MIRGLRVPALQATALAVVLGTGLPAAAQFQLPPAGAEGTSPAGQLPKRLTYQYGIGSESEIRRRRDADLDRQRRDDALIVMPQLNGHIIYRPTDWLETTLEVIFEKEFPVREEAVVTLPDGETVTQQDRHFSLVIDQAFFTLKNITDPFEISVGRINHEDERHWLYDTSMDVAEVSFKRGGFEIKATAGREVAVDLDLLQRQKHDRNNTFMLYGDYRGVEGLKLAAYSIYRDDREKIEGHPLLLGLRALGRPSNSFSYWGELAFLKGSDERSREFSGYGVDVGATYRFLGQPLTPNITLAYAFGSGDRDPNDDRKDEFRQSGLQSNETKFGGVSEFKVYGEALDPELSNLRVLTAGLGVRPIPDVSVDLVFHHYRLDRMAEELRNSALTARMNQVSGQESKDVGSALDMVVGVRNLFGIRQLGIDLRGGLFFPGKAFRIDTSSDESISSRAPETGMAVVAKFWW
jgi:alginate production protein